MALNQSLRQQSCRTFTSSTSGTYEENWLELFDAAGLGPAHQAAGITTFNGRLKDYLELAMAQRYGSLAETMTAFARFATAGASQTWNEFGTFDPSKYTLPTILHGFDLMTALPAQIAFARGTQAWDYNLVRYGDTEPRLTDGLTRGLLVEASRENLLLQSGNMLQTWAVDSGSVRPATVFKPNLSERAYEFYNSTSGYSKLRQGVSALTSAARYVMSVYMRANTGSRGYVELEQTPNTGTRHFSGFDVATDSFFGGAGFAARSFLRTAENWRNVWIAFDADATAGTAYQGVDYGDGRGLYFAQADLQLGSVLTTPIVTAGSTMIRAAETTSETTTAFSIGRAGTAKVAFKAPAGVDTSVNPVVLSLNDGTNNNRVDIRLTGALNNAIQIYIVSGGVFQGAFGTVTATPGQIYQVAASWDTGSFKIQVNGGTVESGGFGEVLPTAITRVNYGCRLPAGDQLNAPVISAAVWNSVLDPLPVFA